MFKYSKFDNLLKELEASYSPDRDLKRFYKYLENDNVYVPLFTGYVIKRLEENIHPERLLNLAYHMERSADTQHLSKKINDRLASRIVKDQENYDQFLFMHKHDTRVERNVLKSLIEQLKYASAEELTQVATKIEPYIGVDRHTLILRVLEHESEMRNLSNLFMMERLQPDDQYMVLVRALENNSKIFIKAFDWGNNKFHTSFSEKLSKVGDQDQLITALSNTTIPISEIQTSPILSNILVFRAQNIPNTIDKLYKRAEEEEEWEFVLALGTNKNKKDLLRSLIKAKDQKLIDRFFALYKSCPEVKHLVPFM